MNDNRKPRNTDKTIEQRWRAVSIWQLLGTVVGMIILFVIGAVASGIVVDVFDLTEIQSNQIDAVVLPLMAFLSIGIPFWFFVIRKHGWSLLQFRRASARWVLIAIAVGIVWIIAGNLLSELLSRLFDVERRAQVTFTSTFVDTLFLLISAGIVGPIVEEILLRGVIFNWLRARIPLWAAVIISSLLFMVIHFNPIAAMNLFIMGIIFALLYVRSQSLWVPIIAHMAGNSFIILYNYIV